MAELWEVLSTNFFEPIAEKDFHILEKLYVSPSEGQKQVLEIDPTDLERLLQLFNEFTNKKASEVAFEKPGAKVTVQDNEFLHFAVSCKYYLPLLSGNSMVGLIDLD